MAFNEELAARVRRVLAAETGIQERKMFGGLAFLLDGNMCCGIMGDRLMVRLGREAYEAALTQPHVHKMDFTGKPMRSFIYVEAPGVASEKDLAQWVRRGATFAASLPAK